MSAKLAALIDEFEIPIEEVIKWYPAVTSLSTSNCQFEHLLPASFFTGMSYKI